MRSRRAALPALLSALAMLAGCQTTSTPSAVIERAGAAPFCAVAEPIFYSRTDTPETRRQIREHNAVGMALGCPAFVSASTHPEAIH